MFSSAIDTLGQTEEGSEYQLKTSILATVERIKPVEFSKTSGKPGQSLFLQADGGEQSWVKLIGTFDELDNNCVGNRYEFLVWPFKPDKAPKPSLYCWLQRQVDQGANPQPGQSTPQTPPTPRQATNTQNEAHVSDAELLPTIRRSNVLESVAIIASRRTNMDVVAILDMCGVLDVWVRTGEVDFTVTHQSADPNQDDSDLPLEMRGAGKP